MQKLTKSKIAAVAVVSAIALSTAIALLIPKQNSSAQAEDQSKFSLKYDEDCKVKDHQNDQVITKNSGAYKYTLYVAHKQDREGYLLTKDLLVRSDATGCSVLHAGAFLEATPDKLKDEFALAYWTYYSQRIGGGSNNPENLKNGIEDWLENSPVLQPSAQSLVVFKADIKAFNKLKIKYPKYLKGIDEFKSNEEAQAYYDEIFTNEWYAKRPLRGSH